MANKKKGLNRHACLGTGLIALDLVTSSDEDSEPSVWAGGSCGNVLTILAYLGWRSYPVARLGDDAAGKVVVRDMARHGVCFKYVSFDQSVYTPIILQRILIARDGHPTHRFYWRCPNCGNWLPRYSPIRLQDVRVLCERSPHAACFYFDRVCPASLRLAEKAKEQGSLVVFEPASIKDDPQFNKAITMCDILKYSNERSKNSPKMAHESPARVVVETLGAEGLRYRLRWNGRSGEWKLLPAFRVRNLKDAAGAGDWCTAGMIHVLAGGGASFDRFNEKKIVDALRYGQALSALNCGFEGARGAMYGLKKAAFIRGVQSILDLEEACSPVPDLLSSKIRRKAQCICPSCQDVQKIVRNNKRE